MATVYTLPRRQIMPSAIGRVPALDGLRGFALLAVLAYHAAPGAFRGGFLGVEIFFVLSGYLLTSGLLAEHDRTGRINVFAYAARRLRRIFPGLFVLLAVLALFVPVIAPDATGRLRDDVLYSLRGVTNWLLISDGSSYFGRIGRPPFVRHIWSIAIEVQFYVLCPVLVTFIAKLPRRTAVALLGTGIAMSASAMAALYAAPDPSRAYYGTDARIGAVVTGSLLGYWMSRGPVARTDARWPRVGGPAAVATLVALLVAGGETAQAMYPFGFLASQAATAVVIAIVHRGAWPAAIASSPMMRWFGERSYGIYLWHWPLIIILRPGIDVTWPAPVAAFVAAAGGIGLGAVSYALVELPWMRWRPELRRVRSPVIVGASGVAMLVLLVAAAGLIRPPASGTIEDSLREGERLLAAAEAQAPAAPPQPAPALPVAAIGDSVMLGAVPQLQSRFADGHIDAAKSRQFHDGIAAARRLREAGRLGRVTIVHLGNNGPMNARHIDALMTELAPVQHVVFVTLRVPKAWENPANQVILDAARRHASLKIVDWRAHSEGHGDWFAGDGTHLNPLGAGAYADLLAGAVPPGS